MVAAKAKVSWHFFHKEVNGKHILTDSPYKEIKKPFTIQEGENQTC
jgi:hypothetical protein